MRCGNEGSWRTSFGCNAGRAHWNPRVQEICTTSAFGKEPQRKLKIIQRISKQCSCHLLGEYVTEGCFWRPYTGQTVGGELDLTVQKYLYRSCQFWKIKTYIMMHNPKWITTVLVPPQNENFRLLKSYYHANCNDFTLSGSSLGPTSNSCQIKLGSQRDLKPSSRLIHSWLI